MIVSKSGRELFKHHIDTTDGLTFNCSANHLLVLFVLKGTIFLLFADFMFFFSAVNIAKKANFYLDVEKYKDKLSLFTHTGEALYGCKAQIVLN